MECFGALVFILAIAALFAGISAVQSSEMRRSYQRLSDEFGGSYQCGGWFNRPSVRFQHAGTAVTIDVGPPGSGSSDCCTQASFSWPQLSFRCELYREDAAARLRKLRGMQDIEIGSPDFDAAYIIQGNSPDELRCLLNAPVQRHIEQLRRFLGSGDIYVSINGGTMVVKKRMRIERWLDLRQFAGLAIGLYDQATLTLQSGIELVEGGPAPPADKIICQVCGEPITSDKVICRLCKTPHHQDCWEYYGACSTYGCRETSYLVPTRKRPATRRPI